MAPISHVAGTKVLPTLMRGGTVHMLKGFDPEAVFKTIERERINFTLFVPTMIYVMLDHPALDKTDLSSLELLLYGASAMSPSRLVEGIERIGPVFSQLYGQTECYPVSVLRKADHDPRTPELFLSCGFPIAACQVRILDNDDREVATGEAGEICVRATHVMAEYWKRPDITAETLKSGWLHTGDIARKDERGYMFILDRKKDMIVSGGFNIFPREVEDVLSQHADVAMVAVVGVPDDKWGEAVTAVIVAREGAQPNADELINLVKARKGSAHAPKHIKFVDELPMTGVGKVDKKVLKASFWTGRDGWWGRNSPSPCSCGETCPARRPLPLRKDLRPHRAPLDHQRTEVRGLKLMAFGTRGRAALRSWSAGHAPLGERLRLVEIVRDFDVDLQRRDGLAPLQLDDDLVGIEHYMFRHHGENFLPQRGQQVGLAEQSALMRQQNLQPFPGDGGGCIAAAKQPQQIHAHAALRPNSRFMKPLRSAGTTIATSSPIKRREAST